MLQITVLNRGVVVCHKQFLKKLYRDGTFSHTAISDNHQFDSWQIFVWRPCHRPSGAEPSAFTTYCESTAFLRGPPSTFRPSELSNAAINEITPV